MPFYDCDDVPQCVRESTLSIASCATAGGLCFALCRRLQTSHGRSIRDALILLLSALQTILSALYYGFIANPEILLAARILKVLQTAAITWMFLAAVCINDPGHISVSVVVSYALLVSIWSPNNVSLCQDATWVNVSIIWFIMAVVVSLVGIYFLRQKRDPETTTQRVLVPTEEDEAAAAIPAREDALHVIDGRTPISFDDVETAAARYKKGISFKLNRDDRTSTELSILHETSSEGPSESTHQETATLPAPSIIGRQMTAVRRRSLELHDTQIERKRHHLLLLVLIEASAAGVTMAWDIILWFSLTEEGETCNHFLSTVVYILSRAIALLVPHWSVFFVFYWIDRNLYRPYSSRWDIDLRGVELRPH